MLQGHGVEKCFEEAQSRRKSLPVADGAQSDHTRIHGKPPILLKSGGICPCCTESTSATPLAEPTCGLPWQRAVSEKIQASQEANSSRKLLNQKDRAFRSMRPHQQEVYDHAVERNVIAYLPTGMLCVYLCSFLSNRNHACISCIC